MIEAPKYYNVKILETYVKYMRAKYSFSEEKIEKLLGEVDLSVVQIRDQRNWFDQKTADKFYDLSVVYTNNENLAYDVGKWTVEGEVSHSVRMFKGLLKPSLFFKQLEKLSRQYSKAAQMKAEELQKDNYKISVALEENATEKPYQCENRLGTIASMCEFFDPNFRIEHSKCLHKGDSNCVYSVRVKSSNLNINASYVLLLFLILSFVSTFVSTSYLQHQSILIFLVGFISILYLIREKKVTDHQSVTISENLEMIDKDALEQNLLVQLVGSSGSHNSIEELYNKILADSKDILGYDRGIVLVEDDGQLVSKSFIGFEEREINMMKKSSFNIRSSNREGIFVSVFNSAEAMFVRNTEYIANRLSPKSQSLLRLMKSKSMIVIPLVEDNKSIGILAVDNISNRMLGDKDFEVLKTLAKFISLTLENNNKYLTIVERNNEKNLMVEAEIAAKKDLSKYVSSNVVESIYNGQTRIQPSKEYIAVTFIDLIGFSKVSELEQPEIISKMLDTYIGYVSEYVNKTSGVINKIMGDGILVYHSKPLDAIRFAEDVMDNLYKIKNIRINNTKRDLCIGLGQHAGPCVVGTIGNDKTLDYTLIGDTVNTASRLESLTREVHPDCALLSEEMMKWKSNDNYVCLGEFELKNKVNKVKVYQYKSKLKKLAA